LNKKKKENANGYDKINHGMKKEKNKEIRGKRSYQGF